MLKSYIRETLRDRRAGKRLRKSKRRLVHQQPPPSAAHPASRPVPIKLWFIIGLHLSISISLTLSTIRPDHFKPTADLQVISGLASNKATYLTDTGRGRMYCPFLMCSSHLGYGHCLHRVWACKEQSSWNHTNSLSTYIQVALRAFRSPSHFSSWKGLTLFSLPFSPPRSLLPFQPNFLQFN